MITTRRYDWYSLFAAQKDGTKRLRIISPFIRTHVVDQILRDYPRSIIEVITRFDLNGFRSGASQLDAIQRLLNAGASVGGIAGLHSKVYLFDERLVIIGSANLTYKGFYSNQEYGVEVREPLAIASTHAYFDDLWSYASKATAPQLRQWQRELAQAPMPDPAVTQGLPDYGGNPEANTAIQYFVKFLGTNEERVGLDFTAQEEVVQAHCHYAVPFSLEKGRPTRYHDGDIVYISRMTANPNDHAVFGRAIALRHVPDRDMASAEERALLKWKDRWPVYIRVHDPVFINTTLGNCPMLNQLMQDLGADSYARTMERQNRGEQNIRPKGSLSQQADVRLSVIGARWMADAFQRALDQYGSIEQSFIDSLHQGTLY